MEAKEMKKAYDPHEVEDKIYDNWEKSGYFNPDNLDVSEDAESYSIVLPPPNITAKLHLGHASMVAIEDIFIRFARMTGKRALWIPGTDHAAIATQNVVEKKLWDEEKKTRHDLGREEFLKKVWDFLYETQAVIQNQIRKMGGSLDWSRECFTLDEMRVKTVREMFCRMYEEGVIYKGHRIVNWCPRCASTLADDEVEYETEKTKFYYMKYGPITIATVRPETKFLDKVIVVHPEDERYKDMIGKKFMIPWINGEIEAQVIADDTVNMEMGSGAMTITPAHSFVDFEIAQKHDLEIVSIIDKEGKLTDVAEEFSGKVANEIRDELVNKMQEKGLIERIDENYEHQLSVCYRCSSSIEPLVSEQWFVGVDKKIERLGNRSLKECSIEAAKNQDIQFIPNRFEKSYLQWMENLHDWCISRQIWFGHRIPVWYCDDCNEMFCSREEIVSKCMKCDSSNIHQDEDSLDTWFSSGTWTFSTLGWPEETNDLKKFHPTMVLETGYDILTLWVSRMIMMSFFAMEEVPFKYVYLHGLVLDMKGKKMSKSKGNGIDPLEMIEKYGTDAMRMSLVLDNTPGNNLRLGEEKIEQMKRFVNKLWNISRYILTTIKSKDREINVDELTLADQWILQKNNQLIKDITQDLKNYKIASAADKLKEYTWGDLADWYLEISKIEGNKDAILIHLLKDLLKMWHPFLPFATEYIWSYLGQDNDLIVSEWPKADTRFNFEKSYLNQMQKIQDVITSIRNIRAENKIDASKKIDMTCVIQSDLYKKMVQENTKMIQFLARVEQINVTSIKNDRQNTVSSVLEGIEIIISLEGLVDFKKEKERLLKELSHYQGLIKSVNNKLADEEFVQKAPEIVVEKEKNKLKEYSEIIKSLEKNLDEIK